MSGNERYRSVNSVYCAKNSAPTFADEWLKLLNLTKLLQKYD